MHAGIDIGTTHISATVLDVEKRTLKSTNSYANRRMVSTHSLMYEQDPVEIERIVRDIIAALPQPIESITVTGQVHGITYYDRANNPVSPHSTWLDRRSEIVLDGESIEQKFETATGIHIPAGYGFLTHYANTLLGIVPETAVGFCGILEFITGRLIGRPLEKSESSCLGTMGSWNPVKKCFDPKVLEVTLTDQIVTPLKPCDPFEIAGYTDEGIPVLYPVGDNQAGFFALVKEGEGATLISIGTSGQISYFSHSPQAPETMELRNLLDSGFIHVGATLTSGKAYENLKNFFESVYSGLTGECLDDGHVFDMMKKAADRDRAEEAIRCAPLFSGTRRSSAIKGSYSNITLNNFTMGQMVRATVNGIVEELHEYIGDEPVYELVATGSAVEKNHLFRNSLERIFSTNLTIPSVEDGAAFGAALVGAIGTGKLRRAEKDGFIESFRV